MKCGELPLTIYGYLWIDPWSLRGGIPVEMSANAYSVDLRLPGFVETTPTLAAAGLHLLLADA